MAAHPTDRPASDVTTAYPSESVRPTSPPPEPPRRRPWLGWLIAVAVVVALGFVKLTFFPAPASKTSGGRRGSAGAGRSGGTPVEVFVVTATPLADEVASTGSVLAEEAVTIRSEVAGKITALHIREGQPVRRGDLLLTINAAEVQAQLQKQAANLALYADQERRQRALLEKEYISAQEYERSNNQLLTARADEAALRATLAKTTVRAPFDGVLGLTTATVGAYVSPGDVITTLSKVQPVKIDFRVPGRYADAVRVGDTVRVTDEGSARTYAARVYALDPQIDPVSRTLPVRARFANTRRELRPGAFVRVALQLGQASAALQIPTEAVTPEASGYTVFVVKDGKATKRPVQIGVRSDARIEITSGLSTGDSVVRTGILQLKPGDRVTVRSAASPVQP